MEIHGTPGKKHEGRPLNVKQSRQMALRQAFLRRFFRNREGKPADVKYCLTESFFELLAGLLALPGDVSRAFDGFEEVFQRVLRVFKRFLKVFTGF